METPVGSGYTRREDGADVMVIVVLLYCVAAAQAAVINMATDRRNLLGVNSILLLKREQRRDD